MSAATCNSGLRIADLVSAVRIIPEDRRPSARPGGTPATRFLSSLSLLPLPSSRFIASAFGCDARWLEQSSSFTIGTRDDLIRSLLALLPSLPPPSMSGSSAFDSAFQWPVDLKQLIHFALYDTQAQLFVKSSCNTFSQPFKRSDGTFCVDRRVGLDGCWDRLPEAWREYFESVTGADEREALLVRLSRGEAVRPFSLHRWNRSG